MIGALLARSWHESEFLLFFRLYLVMLSEFVKNLADVAGVMGLEVAEPPVFVCSWCNNVAKHRVALLIQHHPACVIADKYGAQWRRFEASLPSQTIVDACGIPRPLELIGRNWFKGHHKSDTAGANDAKQAVIVIPPLIDFLEPTIAYLREFVDACHADP